MMTFEDRLARRMHDLDAAIPSPRPLVRASRARTPARRRAVLLIAAVLALGGATAVAAERMLYPDLPEPRLEAIVESVFNDSDCPALADVQPRLREAMDQAGYGAWTIDLRPSPDEAPCAAAAVIPPLHSVAIFRHGGPEMARALEELSEHLRVNCLNRAEALQLATSVLKTLGYADFKISADPWGPQGGPLDKPGGFEAYAEHAQHCFVYSGLGGEENGRIVIYLWGPWL